jgi:hypothetical protein
MNLEFLLFANLTLLLRLRWLLADEAPGARAWWTKTAIEVAALLLLLRLDAGTLGAAATSIVVNAAAIICDRRARDRNAAHLVLGVIHLAALSLWLGPALSVNFRAGFVSAVDAMIDWSSLGPAAMRVFDHRIQVCILGLLLAANEANLLIRSLLGRLQFRPGANTSLDANEFARGRVIGLLERTLIYFFVLHGQFGAVGFTLAAKAFTRFKELEKRSFAEYVLIGTLLSSGLAMLIATLARRLA